jgi:Protein of unknown function (DUF2778)
MPLQGKFIVNNADFSPLIMYGIGTFLAFSGNKAYRNRGGCVAVPNNGPLPHGRYWIVDRPSGNFFRRMYVKAKDIPTWITKTPTDHSEWFALYRDDGFIDDQTWINGVQRGNFRLHPIGPLGVSEGCITLQGHSDFQAIRNALLRTSKIPVRATGLEAYGLIEVITHGNTCP